ncbi:ABC-type transport auxiliary lipoprotein family protein [Aestuariispira insulae]|uniref:Cholesterol transport system auxiliary component n=1 Tax=Aestuariispira insulae TaxID=1461337 RepID=A0A3D9HIA9_9PROT|nr:ABC-type transport auxiliary lipoprotein family protein [Aestuariispira insulae]RED49165.1 cholesterol transport system auxiliary component [Aestuariispira insulae]
MRNILNKMAVLGLLAAFTACSVELPGGGDPGRIFVLSPKSTFEEGLPTVDWQLLVDVPITANGIGNSRIALRQTAMELKYYSHANWTDSAPKMIQALLIESFENSGKIVSVGRQTIGLRADFIMQSDLREFQAEYLDGDGAGPTVRVRMNAKLIKMPERVIVASKTVEKTVKAEDKNLDMVIVAYDEALGKVMKRIVGWALKSGEEVWRDKGRVGS